MQWRNSHGSRNPQEHSMLQGPLPLKARSAPVRSALRFAYPRAIRRMMPSTPVFRAKYAPSSTPFRYNVPSTVNIVTLRTKLLAVSLEVRSVRV